MMMVLHGSSRRARTKAFITRDGGCHWKIYFPGFASVVEIQTFSMACLLSELLK